MFIFIKVAKNYVYFICVWFSHCVLVFSLCLGLFVYRFSHYVWFFCVHLFLLVCLIFLCAQFVYWMLLVCFKGPWFFLCVYLVFPMWVFGFFLCVPNFFFAHIWFPLCVFWFVVDVLLAFFLCIFSFPLCVLSHP